MRKAAFLLTLVISVSCQHKGSGHKRSSDSTPPQDSDGGKDPTLGSIGCESIPLSWEEALKDTKNNAFLAKIFAQNDSTESEKMLEAYRKKIADCKVSPQ